MNAEQLIKSKGKAKELFDNFYDLDEFDVKCSAYCNGGYIEKAAAARKCALILVEEIINDIDATSPFEIERLDYWQKVKSEIEKL